MPSVLDNEVYSLWTTSQIFTNTLVDCLRLDPYNCQRGKLKWMSNSHLPSWGVQYFSKKCFIFFIRTCDVSIRAAFFNFRSKAVACLLVSVSGVIGAWSIRRLGLLEPKDLMLLELLEHDGEDQMPFNCLSLSGGEIEESKSK